MIFNSPCFYIIFDQRSKRLFSKDSGKNFWTVVYIYNLARLCMYLSPNMSVQTHHLIYLHGFAWFWFKASKVHEQAWVSFTSVIHLCVGAQDVLDVYVPQVLCDRGGEQLGFPYQIKSFHADCMCRSDCVWANRRL